MAAFQAADGGPTPLTRSKAQIGPASSIPQYRNENGLKEETFLPKKWLVACSGIERKSDKGSMRWRNTLKLAKGADNPSVDLVSIKVRTS